MRLLQISTKPVVGKFYFIFVVWFSFSFFNLFLILSWASLGNLKWVDGNCTLPLAFRKEVSRVMPQSPHKPGNQKRGLEHGERTETPYFCHSLPRYTPHPPQVLAGLGDRGWDCLPSSREAPLSLSLPASFGVPSHSVSPQVVALTFIIHLFCVLLTFHLQV